MRTRVAGLVALAAALPARAADEDLPEIESVAVGDFDGDGATDVAVGLPRMNTKLHATGLVRVFSGKTGALLRTLPGAVEGEAYGLALAAVGDVDGDGATDLAVAAPHGERPHVDLVSPATGRRLRIYRPRGGTEDQWADHLCPLGDGAGKARVELLVHSGGKKEWRVHLTDRDMTAGVVADAASLCDSVPAGDVDGDGAADVAVCDWNDDVDRMPGAGRVLVFSGDLLVKSRAKTPLLTLVGEHAHASMGASVVAAGDWDGDGKGDLLACVAGLDEKKDPPQLRVHSGKDGSVLWTAVGPGGASGGPCPATTLGDVDGDGRPEVAVSSMTADERAGIVRLLSSKDGAVLWTTKGGPKETLGFELRRVADADGDGVADLLVTASGVKGAGYFRVLSGRTGATLARINPYAAK